MNGIKMPVLQHAFRVVMDYPTLAVGVREGVSNQVLKCTADFTKQTVTVVIEQAVDNKDMLKFIEHISGKTSRLTSVDVHYLYPNGTGKSGVQYQIDKVISHKFDLDYAIKGTAKHVLVFKYTDIVPF